jgi:hypothetical protein
MRYYEQFFALLRIFVYNWSNFKIFSLLLLSFELFDKQTIVSQFLSNICYSWSNIQMSKLKVK